MWRTVNDQTLQSNLFEAVMTLIIQEQHFLGLLNKIKRSFIFNEQLFDLEILTYDQISDIHVHFLAIYSQKELILHYHNLLDFRFAQGSIQILLYTTSKPQSLILSNFPFIKDLLYIYNQIQQSDRSYHHTMEFDWVIYKTIC